MASRAYVFNETRGCYRRYKDALKAIHEHCACCWVIEGETMRDLTPQEAVQARNVQARLREPLEYAESPGLRYEPPVTGVVAFRNSRRLVFEAHRFAIGAGCAT